MRKTSQKFSQSHMLCKVALVAIMLAFQAMLGIGAGVLNAQTVKGTVISGSDNEPLIGASVMVQGTKTGAVTDLDGNFTMKQRMDKHSKFRIWALSPKRLKLQVRQST